MSKEQLERLRAILDDLMASEGADTARILEVSRRLDLLIVRYMKENKYREDCRRGYEAQDDH